MLQVLSQWMHLRGNALETSKHRWQEQSVKKAMCTLEDRGQNSSREWEDGAYPISFCLIMSVSTYFRFVGNSAHNATRLSLSNKSFLWIKSCVFFSYWAHLCTYKTIAARIFGRVSPFFQNYACFHKGFLGDQSLVQKQKSCWCLFKQTSFGNLGDSLER